MPTGTSNCWPPPAECGPPPDSNPFASCYVRPGSLPYVFPSGITADVLVDRLRQHGWRGQITGPHGSGKSTLLQTLLPALEAAGRLVEYYPLHPGAATLGSLRRSSARWNGDTQVVIDGYEQLGWLRQQQVRWTCLARGAGLLVTAHRPLRLPVLWQTEVSLALTSQIVQRLLAGRSRSGVTEEAVAQAFAAQRGNLREVLFALYDRWEADVHS